MNYQEPFRKRGEFIYGREENCNPLQFHGGGSSQSLFKISFAAASQTGGKAFPSDFNKGVSVVLLRVATLKQPGSSLLQGWWLSAAGWAQPEQGGNEGKHPQILYRRI
ncbi:MAG TPA: hypothetical protein VNQ79_06475 [Blastocatellia bacterium]|nr:hypothetical protein [Blastocatellia bacterium]